MVSPTESSADATHRRWSQQHQPGGRRRHAANVNRELDDKFVDVIRKFVPFIIDEPAAGVLGSIRVTGCPTDSDTCRPAAVGTGAENYEFTGLPRPLCPGHRDRRPIRHCKRWHIPTVRRRRLGRPLQGPRKRRPGPSRWASHLTTRPRPPGYH